MRFLGKYFAVIVLRRIDIEIRVLSRNAVPSFLFQTLELLARSIFLVSELVQTKCYLLCVHFIFSRLATPDSRNPNSIPTFGYRNVLPLNKNASDFQVSSETIVSRALF